MDTVAKSSIYSFDLYPIEIKLVNGLYYLICKRFNIIESDASLEAAYAKLNASRNQYVEKLQCIGVPLNLEKDCAAGNDDFLQNSRSSRKYVISLIIFVPLFLFAVLGFGVYKLSVSLSNGIGGIVTRAEGVVAKKIKNSLANPSQVSDTLNSIANTLDNVTPERKKQIQLSIRKIVAFVKPFVDELEPLKKDSGD